MAETGIEMSLDDVIRTKWKPAGRGGGRTGTTAGRGRGRGGRKGGVAPQGSAAATGAAAKGRLGRWGTRGPAAAAAAPLRAKRGVVGKVATGPLRRVNRTFGGIQKQRRDGWGPAAARGPVAWSVRGRGRLGSKGLSKGSAKGGSAKGGPAKGQGKGLRSSGKGAAKGAWSSPAGGWSAWRPSSPAATGRRLAKGKGKGTAYSRLTQGYAKGGSKGAGRAIRGVIRDSLKGRGDRMALALFGDVGRQVAGKGSSKGSGKGYSRGGDGRGSADDRDWRRSDRSGEPRVDPELMKLTVVAQLGKVPPPSEAMKGMSLPGRPVLSRRG